MSVPPAGGHGGYGGYGQPPAPRRPWALILVAVGCVVALLFALVLGVGIFALTRGGDEEPTAAGTTDAPTESGSPTEESPSETPTEDEGSGFEVVDPIDDPPGDADELWAIMADNPLTGGTLPEVASCDLPATPAKHDEKQLQAVLDASLTCINRVWAGASSDRDLPWVIPDITVFTWPDVPAESACAPDTFDEGIARVCHLDGTIYWPMGYGEGSVQSDDAAVPAVYLWDLSYLVVNVVVWNSSLNAYYVTLDEQLADDPERRNDASRRYYLQLQCLAAATSMQQPENAQPVKSFRDAATDASNWDPGTGDAALAPAARVQWLKAGFESQGDISVCNTWNAPADQVAAG